MKEMLEGFVADYREGGWLPCWTALDAKKCMPSTLIDAVITDAAAKGIIGGELLETAFEGMEKHANTPGRDVNIIQSSVTFRAINITRA